MKYTDSEMRSRIASHDRWVCPDCGGALEPHQASAAIPGKGHDARDRARKCPACPYVAVGPNDWDVADPLSRDSRSRVHPVTPYVPKTL
jgi:hypothetical protein